MGHRLNDGSTRHLSDQHKHALLIFVPLFLSIRSISLHTTLSFFPVVQLFFHKAVQNDTLFLSIVNVVDYSILVGFDENTHEVVVGIIDYMRQVNIFIFVCIYVCMFHFCVVWCCMKMLAVMLTIKYFA